MKLRDLVLVRLPFYLRALAIVLIVASPILAAMHFHGTLCYFDKVMYHPSFGVLVLSAIWMVSGYGLEKYIDYELTLSDLSGARHYRDVDRYFIIIIGTQTVLIFVSVTVVNCLAPF
jgi:hypothetical protein